MREVLELGCGTGRWMAALGERGYTMTGVDSDPAALAIAREKCRAIRPKATLIEHDLYWWNPSHTFDAIISPNNTLKWLPSHDSLRKCLGRMAASIRPGGIAVLDLTFEESDWRSSDWGTADDLREHAWVSKFTGPGISWQYTCYNGPPNLHAGTIAFVERFECRDHGREVVIEEKSTWLLFSAQEFNSWVLETGLLDEVRYYEKRTSCPTEIGEDDLARTRRQCLAVCCGRADIG